MLDRLIESKKNTKETRRLGGFLLTTATGAVFVLMIAFIYSLFAYDVVLASDNLMLSALVAPVQITEQKPQEERATAAPKQQTTITKTLDKLPTRRENIMRVDEQPTKVPDVVSVSQNQNQARPSGRFTLSDTDSNVPASGAYTNERGTGTGAGAGVGISNSSKPSGGDAQETAAVAPPPPLVVKPVVKEVEQPKKVTVISGGVVNGKASNLVTPVYSSAAKAVRAQGEVRVAVTIDEDGRVTSANALSGNPLLTAAAVSAARASKFTPTLLSNQRVKVTGIIVYNFKV